MRTTFSQQNRLLIILVVAVLVVLLSLVGATVRSLRLKKNFQDEMAQRLDLEEKVSKMERERQGFLSEIKRLSDQIAKSAGEIEKLQINLDQEKTERAACEAVLEKIRAEQKTGSGRAM